MSNPNDNIQAVLVEEIEELNKNIYTSNIIATMKAFDMDMEDAKVFVDNISKMYYNDIVDEESIGE